MKIKSSLKEYDVIFYSDFEFLDNFKSNNTVYFVIDKNVYGLYKNQFADISTEKLYILTAEEENKNIDTALDICEKLTALPQKRNIRLVSIGGGIVQDVTGFVANILYRGIYWSFIPTTLLAACDSCIGGKTSLNYKNFKNLLGTFFPPDDIHICSKFFITLSQRDFNSGLGEVIKFNVMAGTEGLDRIKNGLSNLKSRDYTVVDEFVKSSLEFKKIFIEEDEFDRGARVHLNFAHTFGHAFETVSNYFIPHGSAVAMGMLIANRISMKREMLGEETVKRIEGICVQIINSEYATVGYNMDELINAIRKDKKQTNTSLTAVLLDRNLKTVLVNDITREEISQAVDFVINLLK